MRLQKKDAGGDDQLVVIYLALLNRDLKMNRPFCVEITVKDGFKCFC